MNKINVVRFSILLSLLTNALWAQQASLPLLPIPQIVEKQSGGFKLGPAGVTLQLLVRDTSRTAVMLSVLHEGFKVNPTLAGRTAAIVVGMPEQDSGFRERCVQKGLWPDDRLGDEGYVLLIEKAEITLAAHTKAGLFYGTQTLKQLVQNREKSNRVPCLKIVDWPQFPYRGMMDDISRGPVPTRAFMQEQVRRCAEMKLNMLSYYTEHVVRTESHGDFAPAGGALPISEWRALAEYADKHFIQLVGNFQSFGHFEKILSYPQYRHLGEADRLISPAFEESYRFLADVYREMVPAFNSTFFNVDADETWDLGRGASKALVDSLGAAEVYSRHLNRLHAELKKLDQRMMMWGDIVLKRPEVLDKLPGDTIVGTWGYGADEPFEAMIAPIEEAGFDMMISCGVLNSNRIMPDFKMAFANIKGFIETAARHKVMGVLTTVWDDGGSALFGRDWLGVAYAAEKSWNVAGRGDRDFDQRFDQLVYGDAQNHVAAAIWKLTELTELTPTQKMNEAVFWEKLVPDRGEHLSLNLDEWDEVAAICDLAEAHLQAAQPTRRADELDYWRFTVAQYRHLADMRMNLSAAAEAYGTALQWQRQTRDQARARLISSLEFTAQARQSFIALQQDYRSLWLRENRSYWLDRMLEKYDERTRLLTETERLLLGAVKDFDNGHFLPPPEAVRLDIRETKGRYFQYWLMAGPFPNPKKKGYDIDHLVELGGEKKARGKVAGQFKGLDGQTHRWQKVAFPKLAECDLAAYYARNEVVLAYAYARITSPKAQKVRATFGSNDGIKVFCNGELVFERHVTRNLMPDEDEVELSLQAGQNHLLLKIDQGKGGWGFSFRLPDNKVRSHKYKYTIVE